MRYYSTLLLPFVTITTKFIITLMKPGLLIHFPNFITKFGPNINKYKKHKQTFFQYLFFYIFDPNFVHLYGKIIICNFIPEEKICHFDLSQKDRERHFGLRLKCQRVTHESKTDQ